MRRLAIMLMCGLSLSTVAADYAKPNRQETFGDVTIYYNAFASNMLQPAIAASAGLTRSKNLGILNVTVLKSGKPAPSSVSGTCKDLAGRNQPLAFRQVTENGFISYIAELQVQKPETYTFNISVKAGNDESHSFSFDQQLYPGE